MSKNLAEVSKRREELEIVRDSNNFAFLETEKEMLRLRGLTED